MDLTDPMTERVIQLEAEYRSRQVRTARIPLPAPGCEYCDAGFLWHEDDGVVSVLVCACQRRRAF